jgi:hypothetical protein
MPSPLDKIRDCVAVLRENLLHADPEEIEALVPGLTAAAELLSSYAHEEADGKRRSSAPLLQALANELAVCRKLIQQGQSAAGVLASLIAAGYSRSGSATPLSVASTMSLQA